MKKLVVLSIKQANKLSSKRMSVSHMFELSRNQKHTHIYEEIPQGNC